MSKRMWHAARLWVTPVLLAVFACACTTIAKTPVPALSDTTSVAASTAPRLEGADVAFTVNRRYAQTPGKCFVSSPAFECSGVLLRPAPPGAITDAFWRIGADEIAAGHARLDYARQDLPAVNLSNPVGFVLADRPSAVGSGQPYTLVCGRAPLGQTLPPCTGDPDGVGVSLWNVANPAALAVQAVYYDVAHGGQLSQALRYQKQYYDGTGQWVPILIATIGDGTATAFGFNERDQLNWGFTVARDLEARHADTRMTCPGNTAPYNCSGVLIRITGSGDFKSWNPTELSMTRNGVSFSYARADMALKTTHSGGPGIIMRELQAPTAHPLTWRCAFPTNGNTNARGDSCPTPNGDARLCDARGILTATQWKNSYGVDSAVACGLSPSASQFAVLQELRQTVNSEHNEVVIAAWPQNIPEQIPIEAWFYPTADAKPGAVHIQQDYMATTGHFMPVLAVTLTNPAGSIYVYRVDDQVGAMSPGSVLTVPGNGGPYPDW